MQHDLSVCTMDFPIFLSGIVEIYRCPQDFPDCISRPAFQNPETMQKISVRTILPAGS